MGILSAGAQYVPMFGHVSEVGLMDQKLGRSLPGLGPASGVL